MLQKLRALDVTSRVILLATGILLGVFAIQQGRASQASCVMPTSGTVSGLTLVNDINACNGALLSLYSGAGAPGSPTPGMFWYNTTSNFIQQYDGASWINVWYVDATNHLATAPIGGGVPTASIASAGTTDLGSVPQAFKSISGTATITSFGGSATPGTMHVLKFTGIATLTHNATSLILPGGLNITTAANDIAFAMYLGSSNWQVLNYSPATGAAVSNPALPLGTIIYGDFMTAPAKTVLANGQALARSSYPGYLAAVTRTQSMTRTASNATLTGVASTFAFGVGMPVEGPGISVGCTIASLVANTSITLNNSTCVTASGSASITVFGTGYGSGGDSTTVGVKDCGGRTLAGVETSTSRLTTASSGIDGKAINQAGGLQTTSITAQNQLPSVSFTVSVTSLSLPALTIPMEGKNAPIGNLTDAGFASQGPAGGSASSPLSVIVAAGGSGSGTAASGGTSQPIANTQPTATATCAVAVLP